MLSHYVTVSLMDNHDEFYLSIIVDLPYICIIICPQWFLLNPSPVTENTVFLACERTLSKSVSRLKNRPLHHQSPSPGLRTDLLLFKSYWHEVPTPPFLRLHSNQHLVSKKKHLYFPGITQEAMYKNMGAGIFTLYVHIRARTNKTLFIELYRRSLSAVSCWTSSCR